MRPALLLAGLLTALVLGPMPACARTEGPFTAQVVDAETGRPLPGVVVVALYQRKTPGIVHPQVDFYDLDETVSDAEGRFSLAARTLPMSTPLAHVAGPEFIIFKAGYWNWHFKGVELGQHVESGVRERQHEEGWRKFRGDGVVILMLPAKTRDERERARARAGMFPPIPDDRARRLRKALEDERLGIQNPR
jgi:hypothetical protein